MEQTYKYFAFISYSSHDTRWGKRLQRKLEGYRMPATLCSEHGWERKPIKPVFFAPTDIQPGDLSEELKARLRASRNLIVICSPHSARSEWVAREIRFFHSLGRTDHIHFFIVDGTPHSGHPDTECFNPVLEELGISEKLGANIHEKVYRRPWLNRERAYVQLITKLLGIEFDSIWQRHLRLLRQQLAAWVTGAVAVAATLLGFWINGQAVDIAVALHETTVHNDRLPPLRGAVVTMELDNETKTDTLRSPDGAVVFANILHKALGRPVRFRVACKDWMPVDTTVVLSREVTLRMARNPHSYGDVVFLLWDLDREQGVADTRVTLAGETATSDAGGVVRMFIPLEKQCTRYKVVCDLPLENDTVEMPSTESRSIRVKR